VNIAGSIAVLGSNSRRLSVEYVDIDQLKRNARNPRDHDEKQIAKLEKSIVKFGFVVPCVVDDERRVLAGNARLAAAKRAGMTEVPVVRIGYLTEAEKRAFILADNKLAELATWNEDVLRSELRFLTDLNFDFDFSTIGFDTAEVDWILDDAPDATSRDDDLTALASGQPTVSSPGDLWIAGPHRIYCGDALVPDSYAVLLGADRAQMIFSDPPYNVPILGHVGGSGAVQHREFQMASGEMTVPEFTAFLTGAMKNMAGFSVDGSIHFACVDWRHVSEMLAAGTATYTELKNICVWKKTNAGMGSFYRSQHELICVFKNGRSPHINNIELGKHGRNRSNVWEYVGLNSFGRHRDALLALHPTVKPVALVADAIKDASARGDLILDPFAGSGTTVVAAEKTHRRAAVIEIDPLYTDAIVRRWQAYTGRDAVCAGTGVTFAMRAAAAG
jgi:16S rRNA G966 N2-methylase RsmD